MRKLKPLTKAEIRDIEKAKADYISDINELRADVKKGRYQIIGTVREAFG